MCCQSRIRLLTLFLSLKLACQRRAAPDVCPSSFQFYSPTYEYHFLFKMTASVVCWGSEARLPTWTTMKTGPATEKNCWIHQ